MRGAIPSRPRRAAPRTTADWLQRISRPNTGDRDNYDLRVFWTQQGNLSILSAPLCQSFVEVRRLTESADKNNPLNGGS
jgi:hypothetical protein